MSLKSTDSIDSPSDSLPGDRQLVLAASSRCQIVVTFFWQQDRYGHRLSLIRSGEEIPLLESCEGGPGNPWPPSPPLQEISLMSDATADRSLLLVGKASKCHWSVCAETQNNSSGEPGRLLLDVACRLRVDGRFLGSTYRVLAPIASHDEAQLTMGGVDCGVDWKCQLVAQRVDLKVRTQLTLSESVLVLSPAVEKLALPSTVRWQYALTVCPENAKVERGL